MNSASDCRRFAFLLMTAFSVVYSPEVNVPANRFEDRVLEY